MALPLIEQLARRLNVSQDQAGEALFAFLERLKYDVNARKPAEIRGVGTLQATDEAIRFRPDASLSLLVNNRYAALETETVHVAFKPTPSAEAPKNEPAPTGALPPAGDTLPDLDSALPNVHELASDDTLIGDSLDSAFWDGLPDRDADHPLGQSSTPPFEDADFSVLHPSPNTSNDINLTPESAAGDIGAISMKEDDPKSPLFSDEDSPDSKDEWSPFFEELEGVEFEVDPPTDIDDTVWTDSQPPKPPSSPFANNRNDDEFFFETDRDNELFGATFDDDMPEESTWATTPMDEAPFFEDTPGKRGGKPDPLGEFEADDELFSPASTAAHKNGEDELFSEEELFRNANVAEADETVFLPPDARKNEPATDRSRPTKRDQPPAPGPNTPRAERRPYERRRPGSGNSGLIWGGLVGLLLLASAGSFAYLKGMLPFGPGATSPPTSEAPPEPVPTPDPPETSLATPPATDPGATSAAPNAPATSAPSPTANTRRPFAANRDGWTIVVSSRESQAEAETLVDQYTQLFANEGFPVDILRTTDFGAPRYRVGVGQFGSRQSAASAAAQHARSLPSDAWVLSIER
jgi:hypothetical protein